MTMDSILSKPSKPLIPIRRAPEFAPSIPPTVEVVAPVLQPLQRAIPQEVNTAPQSVSNQQGEAWPFTQKENVSNPPQNASEVPQLQIVTRTITTPPELVSVVRGKKVVEIEVPVTSEIPRLEPIVKPRTVINLENPNAYPTPVLEEGQATLINPEDAIVSTVPPELVPIGDASQQPVAPAQLPEGFVPPTLEVTRRGAGAVAEIPPLEFKARDIHGYVIIGVNPDEDVYDLHGVYLPDELNRLPGTSLTDKLNNLCISKFNDMTDPTMVHRRNSSQRTAISAAVENGNAMNLVALVNILDSSDPEERYVCYAFKAVKFKMNSLGVMLKLNALP